MGQQRLGTPSKLTRELLCRSRNRCLCRFNCVKCNTSAVVILNPFKLIDYKFPTIRVISGYQEKLKDSDQRDVSFSYSRLKIRDKKFFIFLLLLNSCGTRTSYCLISANVPFLGHHLFVAPIFRSCANIAFGKYIGKRLDSGIIFTNTLLNLVNKTLDWCLTFTITSKILTYRLTFSHKISA